MQQRRIGDSRREAAMALLLATREGLYHCDGAVAPLGEAVETLAIARAPSDTAVYYAAATEGRVFRSRDRAHSWEAVGTIPGFRELSCLAVHPQQANRLLAGMEPSALFRSDDGG